MGFFDNLFSSEPKRISEMSDREIIKELKRKDLTISHRAKLIMEAKERGLDIPSLNL